MRSLRTVLIAWTTIGAAAILVTAGIVLYVLVRASLVEQCDRSLLDKSRLLAAITAQNRSKLDLQFDEFDEFDASRFRPEEDRAYLQVWLAEGTTIYRSGTLQEADLQPIAGTVESPVWRWVSLPNGQTGRAVGITFRPREEDAAEHELQRAEESPAIPSLIDQQYLVAEGAQVVISEFLAANDSVLADQDDVFSDWIELHNLSDQTVDLEGWSLTDETHVPKWRFPAVSLGSGEFLLVFASGKDRRHPTGELHADFKLDAEGECLALIRPDGQTIESAYVPEYPLQVADASYGLSADFKRPGYFRRATPGQPNDDNQTSERPTPVSGPVTLVLARDTQSIDDTLARLTTLLLVVGILAIPVLVGVLWLAIRRSLRSLDRLAGQISRLHEHDLSERIDVPGCPQELKPVVDRLNRLLQQLESAFRRERGFSADVAHELRTPLAGLLMKMDLALSQVRQPEEYRDLVGDCRVIAVQMQRMAENLLALSRLEGGRAKLRQEPVVVNELIRDTWKPFAEIARERHVEVNWSLGRDVLLTTDRTQIRVAIRNLLENAVTYVDEGGHVRIASGTEDHTFSFEVSNSGSLLAEEDVQHVFERFWRGDAVRSDAGSHCGLGLSLTSRIVEALGGSTKVRSAKGGDFQIAVVLPKGNDESAETSTSGRRTSS